MRMRFSFRKAFKKAADKIMLAAGTIAVALPSVAAETTVDMSGVTEGIVNLVMALMPVILVLVIVKALIESFARMT